jgi:hypothetical protein
VPAENGGHWYIDVRPRGHVADGSTGCPSLREELPELTMELLEMTATDEKTKCSGGICGSIFDTTETVKFLKLHPRGR